MVECPKCHKIFDSGTGLATHIEWCGSSNQIASHELSRRLADWKTPVSDAIKRQLKAARSGCMVCGSLIRVRVHHSTRYNVVPPQEIFAVLCQRHNNVAWYLIWQKEARLVMEQFGATKVISPLPSWAMSTIYTEAEESRLSEVLQL